MADPIVVESYPCPSCDLSVTLRLIQGGSFFFACPNNHWWILDTVRGWLPANQPEGT
jgi:hypothetical protein